MATASISVALMPRATAEEATSWPIRPAPTIAMCSLVASACSSRIASSSVRRTWTFSRPASAGIITGFAPVAISSRSKREVVEAGDAACPCAARRRGRRARRPAAGSGPAARRPGTALDSGGRSYGACGSAPNIVIGPSWPFARSASAQRCAARPAPTRTILMRSLPSSRARCGAPASSCEPRDEQRDRRDGGGEHERAQPGRAGVGPRAERVDQPEDVDDRGGAVEVAPALAADPAAGVVGQARARRRGSRR